MNSRVKTLVGLVVLVCISLFSACLTHADEIRWDSLKTERIQIENESSGQGLVLTSYPRPLHALITEVLSWDPKKELNNSTQLEPILKRAQIQGEKSIDLREVLRNLSVEFDVSDIQHFRKVWFHLTPQLKIRGLFAIQDFKTPRPLVILRMGIHGNVDELLAERFILKALYEDLKVNVLVLENLTSHAFLSQNTQISFGGVEEGLHTFAVINFLKDKNYSFSRLISDVHLVGVSLGGQGTFVTALLSEKNGTQIKSILNFCPLINFSETFEGHAQKSLKNIGIDFWNYHRLHSLNDHYSTKLRDLELWRMPFDLKPRFTPRVLEILNEERRAPLYSAESVLKDFPKIKWPVGFLEQITQSKSFYEMNDFWKVYQGVKTPIFIYATPKDFLVTNEVNIDRIFEGKQPGDFKSVKIEKLDRGLHCGLAASYMWDDVVKMIRAGLGL
jgi:hypothetical protein